MSAVLTVEPITRCCHALLWRGLRCTGCGHRQTINGIPPRATRALMLDRPLSSPATAVRELRDRRRARRAAV